MNSSNHVTTPEKQFTTQASNCNNESNQSTKTFQATSISPSSSFLKHPPQSLSPISPFKNSKLIQFATVGIAHKVEEILNDKVNYSPSIDEKGWALNACVRHGRDECVKLLVLRGAPVVAKRTADDGQQYNTVQ
jgi:hypothetical protein